MTSIPPLLEPQEPRALVSPGSAWGAWLFWLASISMGGLLWPALQAGPLALDEHVSYWMIDSQEPSSIWERSLAVGAVPPSSFWLQSWALACFGRHEWAMRLPSLVLACGAVPIINRLGVILGGRTCGGLAALLLVWYPGLLDEVRIGRCYGQVVFLATLLLYLTVWWKAQLDAWTRALLWTFASVGLIWTHYTAAPLVFIASLWLFIAGCRYPQPARCVMLLGLMETIVVALTWPLWPSIERLREWGPYLNMLAPESSFWSIVSPFWWFGLPAGVAFAWWGRKLFSSRRAMSHTAVTRSFWSSESLFLLLASILPLLLIAYWAKGDHSSLSNPRYRVAYAPAGALWGAWVVTRVGNWSAALSVAASVVTLVTAWSMEPLLPWQLGRLGSLADRDWQTIGQSIRERSHPGEPILVQSGLVESSLVPAFQDNPLFLEYVACRISRYAVPESHPRWGLPYFWNEETTANWVSLIRSTSVNRVWIAGATDTDLSRNSVDGARQVATAAGFHVVLEQVHPHAILIELAR